ncbi:MAG: hypothetical protein FJ290_18105 [Planctomycetes bacterium]|nr:hypothetical protein [Planctomycetota bacterium]
MKPFIAHTDGKVLIPDKPVALRQGTTYQVRAEPVKTNKRRKRKSPWSIFLEYAGTAQGDYPPDLAENHDHYLHGRPKR